MSPIAISSILDLASRLRIAHHIPGRIRLKIDGEIAPELLAAAGDAKRLGAMLAAAHGVRNVQVNVLAKSCTIDYDAAELAPSAWSDFIAGRRSPEGEMLRRILSRVSNASD
jgi:hypothetical protein